MNEHRCALFGHGLVGEAGVEELRRLGLSPVVVYGHAPGRGDWQPSLAGVARRLGLPYFQDVDFGAGPEVARLASFGPDIIISLYYRDLLPDAVLETARFGGINLHGSPLPLYRGRAPVNWMVLNGETTGGATLHVMTRRPDGGPILGQKTFPIGPSDTAFDVLLNVKAHGLPLLEECVLPFMAGKLVPRPQGKGSYFGRRTPEDGRIDWNRSAQAIFNLIRAVTRPYPGAFTVVGERKLFVWWAAPAALASPLRPGELRWQAGALHAGTGTEPLRLDDVTFEGMSPAATREDLAKR
jgi:methionyl-tRNA formyltransferase